jgi:hypothetical protein
VAARAGEDGSSTPRTAPARVRSVGGARKRDARRVDARGKEALGDLGFDGAAKRTRWQRSARCQQAVGLR